MMKAVGESDHQTIESIFFICFMKQGLCIIVNNILNILQLV